MNKLLSIITVLVCLLSISAPSAHAQATTYYIDDSGSPVCSDSNAGTVPSAPWCSINKLNSALASATPGSTFLLKGGDTWTYNTSNWTTAYPYGIHPSASGSLSLPITIGSYGTGQPILNGASTACIGIDGANAACPSSAEVSGAYVQYITVNNIEVENTTAYGIVFKNSASSPQLGIVISNNTVQNTGCATEPGTCVDNGFYWNQLEYADYQYNADGVQIINNTTQNTGGHNALQVHGDTSPTALVQGNTIIGPWNHNGLDIKETQGLVVNRNVVYEPSASGTAPGEALNYQFTQVSPNSVTFENNLAYGPISGGGLVCSWGGTFDGPTCTSGHCNGTCNIYNNTLMNTVGTSFGTDAVSASAGTETTTIDFRNNITNIRAEYAAFANGTNTIWTHWDYNDDCVGVIGGLPCYVWPNGSSYSTLATFQSGTSLGVHDVFDLNPQFISPSTGNYAIPPNSVLATGGDPSQPAGVAWMGAVSPLAGASVVGVSSCGTLSSSNTIYMLSQAITSSSASSCIILSGNNDTLNFSTFQLTGSGAATTGGTGLQITGSDNLIEGINTSITGFSVPILDQGSYTVGDYINIFSNGVGPELSGTTDNWTNIASYNNTNQGIYVNGCTNGCNITNSNFSSNGGDGVQIVNSTYPTMSLVNLYKNSGNGIHVGCASGCTANTGAKTGNSFFSPYAYLTQNTGDGIFLDLSEAASADRAFVLYSIANVGDSLHDANSTCGTDQWVDNQAIGSTTNAAGVINPPCMTPMVPVAPTVYSEGTPTVSAVSGANSLTGSLAFIDGIMHAGDIAGCWIVTTPGVSFVTQPSGWTAQPNTNLNTPQGRITDLFTHVWQTGDTVAPVFNFSTTGSGEAICFAYAGENQTTPINVTKGMTNTASTTMTSPSIAPGFPNGVLLMLYAADINGTVSNPSIGVIRQSEGNNGRELAIVDATFGPVSATGNQTAQISVSTGSVGVQVFIPNGIN